MVTTACKLVLLATTIVLAVNAKFPCPDNCVCGDGLAIDLQCNIDGASVQISFYSDLYFILNCNNAQRINYDKLPRLDANSRNSFKSVTFKDCPLPISSFKDVLDRIGISKILSLIYQNSKKLSSYLDRKHFTGLEDVTKLLLSVNGITHLPDNLFMDMHNLTWLNIRLNGINLSQELFKPLERLETLEISHNHMTNISANLFSHLSFLRKLSLWQSNVTRFSKDLFSGVDVLEELDLSSNGLNELPSSIFNPLTKLKKLTLFSNKFSGLPSNLFQNNQKLDTVIIFNNDVKLQQLPRGLFSKLHNLKEVYIQRCELEVVPADVFADSPNITNISLAYNQIASLPESIFNDQINLLELDVSHNKISKLEPKIFSSLVKLESLKLNHNFLTVISGSMFSPLLSLLYLDMENNKLKTITSQLFNNNKQRMSINMAYNQLDFEFTELVNNSWIQMAISPLSNTYNLRLLNLSHNEFKITFDDWWFNGHENLDISFNNISSLMSPNVFASQKIYGKVITKEAYPQTMKQIWINNNHLVCVCKTLAFLEQLQNRKTKGAEPDQLNCGFMETFICHNSDTSNYIIMAILLIINILGIITTIVLRKRFYNIAKDFLLNSSFFLQSLINGKGNMQELMVFYSDADEEFICHELFPVLERQDDFMLVDCPIRKDKNNCMRKLKPTGHADALGIVVFSPSYLTSAYNSVNIKKIRDEMIESKNIYIFTDAGGAENSIYAFLKDHRDLGSSVIWNEPNFSNTLLDMLRGNNTKVFDNDFRLKMDRGERHGSFSRLIESPRKIGSDLFTHSHV